MTKDEHFMHMRVINSCGQVLTEFRDKRYDSSLLIGHAGKVIYIDQSEPYDYCGYIYLLDFPFENIRVWMPKWKRVLGPPNKPLNTIFYLEDC